MLAERFTGSGVDVASLITAADRATIQLATSRREKGRDNVARLQLNAVGHAEYRQLTETIQYTGEFVSWFLRAAHQAFGYPPRGRDQIDEISLELVGGTLQYGDWEAASDVTRLERILPIQVAAAGLRLQLANKQASTADYTFMPMYDIGVSSDSGAFVFGMMGRIRQVGEVSDKEGRRARVVKRSGGLVVISQLPVKDQDYIRGEFKEQGPSYGYEVNSAAACKVGKAFERAVEQRGASLEVVPISTNLIMTAQRPIQSHSLG